MEQPHVLIVGGGFGGLGTAQALKRAPVRITLVDKSNHHLFQPLLYQVATAALAPSDIAEPIRAVLRRQRNVSVRMAEVTAVDLAGKTATLRDAEGDVEEVRWDKLVIAAGTSHSYFGHDDWERDAPGLKTLGDALEIRKRVLCAFEQAEWETDPARRQALMTFVVIGAGPTGVELAGAIAEIAFWTVRRDFRHIDTTRARIVLVEATHKVLATYPEPLQASAVRQLKSLGVDVLLGRPVTQVDADGITLGEERIASGTVLWAAGMKGAPLTRTLGVELDRSGRVLVAPDCSIPGHADAFVIGDLMNLTEAGASAPLPGVAQVAMQSGDHVAKQITGDLSGRARQPFHYWNKGSLATIGRTKGIADLGWMRASGFVAWFLWAFVHVAFLITFRNRLLVMVKWGWAWFSFERASRLIWSPSEAAGAAQPVRTDQAAEGASRMSHAG